MQETKNEKKVKLTYGKGNLSLRSFTLWPLYTWRENPQNPLNISLDGHQPPVWALGRRKSFLPPAED
jgi:hypothetical protein